MAGADEIYNLCAQDPPIPCIIAQAESGRTSSLIPNTNKCCPTFAHCALMIMAGNGRIDENCFLACVQLQRTLQKTTPAPPSYEIRAKTLHEQLIRTHNGVSCTCMGQLSEIIKIENDIEHQQDFYEYTVHVKEGVEAAEFECLGFKQRLLDTIPHEPNYGPAYQERLDQIEGIDGGMVAIRYWDEHEQQMMTRVSYTDEFVHFPAYDLARTILEHGISLDAQENLSDGNEEGRKLLKNLF